MTQMLPSVIAETEALAVAGTGFHRYGMGSALIGAGPEATVVIVESGDHPEVSGVQDSKRVLLSGSADPALCSRFDFWAPLPIHVFARVERGCLPLGVARCRGQTDPFDYASLELLQPLSRELLNVVRPVPARGPVPDVDWVDLVDSDPIRALESFVLGWFPAEEPASAKEGDAAGEIGQLPEALAAFYRLGRLRPALHRFPDWVPEQPERKHGPSGDRLVFAVENQGCRDWSIPWAADAPRAADPEVWLTEDPHFGPEVVLEEEPLSRFLLQFTLYEALNSAPFQASTFVMPTTRLGPLWSMLRPVPLSPFLPAYTAEKFFVAPGLLMAASMDDDEAVVGFGALHRATLTPLIDHGFRWLHFDG
ncbi:hypothetical protein H9Y04_29780 [Streptomyces sp. TRM66268-LWL]|uniref:Suppressor of fused-like domain-containing protein n=1 Tax=Streptomyces polyasparticus TaxID=2767826 RepID=A0ABR7SP42_9ACTN|nr:hypothetical protein [Streptomyces polyasparticus]MBC9716732.1 hypothetical protein [Streptomyces polyasparticus]